MLSYFEIFNIHKTTVPLKKKQLEEILEKMIFNGYVQCSYSILVQTIKEIQKAKIYQCTINSEYLFQSINNPIDKTEVLIQVEGIRDYNEFIERIIMTEYNKEWTDFVTYSERFKDEIKLAKCQIISNYLWNVQNINLWIESKNVAILDEVKYRLQTDWKFFKERILETKDLYSFIDSCNDIIKQTAVIKLSNVIVEKLKKYKNELLWHVNVNTKREQLINIKNPIIKKIFILNSFAEKCKIEWPKISFISLDKRNFEILSFWE